MGRGEKRAGFGSLTGATNVRITVGTNSPTNPKDNELWFDTTTSPGTWKYFKKSTSTWTT